jgi:hypothetical protein
MDGEPRYKSQSRQGLALGHLFQIRTDHGTQGRHVFLRTLSSNSSGWEPYHGISDGSRQR